MSKAFDVNNNFYYLPGQTLTLRFDPQREEDFAYSEFPAKGDRLTIISMLSKPERLV